MLRDASISAFTRVFDALCASLLSMRASIYPRDALAGAPSPSRL
jgi:hypothetical protein